MRLGLERIPCDNQIRRQLDGVPAERLDGQFHAMVADLDAGGALDAMRSPDGRTPIALDGTEFHRSRKVRCPNCSTREHNDGGVDLHACQPVCQAMLDAGGDFLLTAKPDSHKALHECLDGINPPLRRCATGRAHRYRWMIDLPIRDGKDALRLNWIEVTCSRAGGKATCRGSFVTSLPVTRDNVAELAECARARWKIENESFNVLKQHGYHLGHNFGHGQDTLANVLAALNLLAFALHTACDLDEYHAFPDWEALMAPLATGGPATQPP